MHSFDFVDHSSVDRVKDCNGFKEGIKQLYAAFPDFYAEINEIVIDSTTGKVVIRWTAKGNHLGQFFLIAPTHKEIFFSGIEIIRVQNGKITERWGEWNGIEILEQMGGL